MAIFDYNAKGGYYYCEKCGLKFAPTDNGYAEAIDHENGHIATVTRSCRYRVNVKQTSKGEEYFDCTVEQEGSTMEEILALSDALVTALRLRYSPEGLKGKEKPVLSKIEGPAEKPTKTPQAEGLGIPLGDTPYFVPSPQAKELKGRKTDERD